MFNNTDDDGSVIVQRVYPTKMVKSEEYGSGSKLGRSNSIMKNEDMMMNGADSFCVNNFGNGGESSML